MFEVFQNRLTFQGDIVTGTAIHIGAAEEAFTPSTVKKAFLRDAAGQPFIPGSSLKGVMRSYMERLLSSESAQSLNNANKACVFPKLCLSDKDELKKLEEDNQGDDKRTQAILDRLCMVCRVFGSPNSAAKLQIRDARVDTATFNAETDFEVRSGVSIDRDLEKASHGLLYDYQVVPRGTRFSFEAVAENVENDEWQFLRALFRSMEMEMLTIGGMTSRGLGSIRLDLKSISLLRPDNLLEVLLNGAEEERLTLDEGELPQQEARYV